MRLDHYTEADLWREKRLRSDALRRRRQAVSTNRSHRLMKIPLVPVPDKPDKLYVPCAYDADGSWHGRLSASTDCPKGMQVRWEVAL